MDIHIIPVLSDNYSYILRDESKAFTAVVDPGEASPIIDFLEDREWGLDIILNTHHHHDHIDGNSELKTKYNAQLVAPSQEAEKIGNVDRVVDASVEDFDLAGEAVQIFDTPGHTLGHICFYLPESRALFAGDTLFSLGCGRIFEGTAEQMYEGIQALKDLPDQTRLYCGHEYTQSNAEFALSLFEGLEILSMRTQMVEALRRKGKPTLPVTMGLEKQTNPFLLAEDVKQFTLYRKMKDNF